MADKYKHNNDKTETTINYAMPNVVNFYEQINPNLTTTNKGVIYFNSTDGEDNAYPKQLVDLYNEGSPTHSALVTLKRDLLIGSGLKSNDYKTTQFIKKINQNGDNLQKVWNKLCMDYALFESYALQVIYKKNGELHSLVHSDMSKVRAMDEKDKETNMIDYWLISNNWEKISSKNHRKSNINNSAVRIANFNPSNWEQDGRQLVVCKQYVPNTEVYSIPSYQSVLQYIMLDRELSNYHLNKVTGGLFANAIVYLTGNPNDNEKRKFINEFKSKYIGSNKEKLLFIWGDFSDNGQPKVIPFSTEDSKEVFEELNDILTQKIITAHRATPELAGIQTRGSDLGGDGNKLAISLDYYINSVIIPMRNEMLDSLNSVLNHFGYEDVYVENNRLITINTQNDNQNNHKEITEIQEQEVQ